MFPILKTLLVSNRDVTTLIQEAKNHQGDGQLEKAFDFYSQAINVML